MNDFEPTDGSSEMKRRDLVGLLIITLVAGLLIVGAIVLGGVVGD